MQNISKTSLPFLMTLNPPHQPKNVLLKWSTWHLVPSAAAAKASLEFDGIQGKRGIWFSEAYHGTLRQEILKTLIYLGSSRTTCTQSNNSRMFNIYFNSNLA